MKLTDEQELIISGLKSGIDRLNVVALAGTGKTTTLLECAKAMPDTTFLYLAFNRSIKEEMERKAFSEGLGNIRIRTQNSFALSYAKKKGLSGQILNSIPVKQIVKMLNLKGNDQYLAYPASKTMQKFCTSSDKHINAYHIPHDVVDGFKSNIRRYSGASVYAQTQELNRRINKTLKIAQRLFDSLDFDSKLTTHDVYVKLCQLGYDSIDIDEDIVMVDEFQDSNPVLHSIMEKINARKVVVGDDLQQLYGWRGARSFNFDSSWKVLNLTKSFRFLPEIADLTNKLLCHMTDLKIVGHEEAQNDGTRGVLCRTNMGCLDTAFKLVGNEDFMLCGGVDDESFKLIEDLVSLSRSETSTIKSTDLKGLKNIDQFYKELEVGLLGQEWDKAINFIERLGGFDQVLPKINEVKKCQKKSRESIMITTVHKAKGQSIGSVHLHDDIESMFYSNEKIEGGKSERTPIAFKDAAQAEQAVLYVAVTRACTNINLGKTKRLFA